MNIKESILGMVLLREKQFSGVPNVIEDLKNNWELEVSDYLEDDNAYSFTVNGESMVIGFADFAIPSEEIEFAFNVTYDLMVNDKNYFNHCSHIIISVLASETNILDRFLIFSKIIISFFQQTDVFGFYYGDANKLFVKNQIIEKEEILKKNKLPIDFVGKFYC